jgi:chemotaxis protein CheD
MMFSGAGLPVVYLKPGEAHFSESPALVMTVLGSCISVTMFSAFIGYAGMCHVVLPRCRTEPCSATCDEPYRYMGCAIRDMVDRFLGKGAKRGEIQVKIFGGSEILKLEGQEKHASVGKQNIEIAKKTLIDEGLKVKASHVGGTFGRKIFFLTHTGEGLMKKIEKSALPAEDVWRQ